MNALIVTAVYPPEPVVSARLSRDIRESLLANGHNPHVLCPQPSRSTQASPKGENGITRLRSYHCADSRLWGRARESWDFGRKAAAWLQAQPSKRFDVIYMNMWPIFGPWHLTRAAARLGIPVVQHVMDVYPESLSTKLPGWIYAVAKPILLLWDRAVAQRCAVSILLSERIAHRFQSSRNLPSERVQVVRNWVDTAPFDVTYDRQEIFHTYDIPADRVTFMYLGNLSALSGLEYVIEAFGELDAPQAQLVIVGEGSAKQACMDLAESKGLENVHFRSEPDPEKVAYIQSMADIFVLPTRKGGASHSTPSKCISYMLSAKPIIACVDEDSDTADDIRSAGCGWIVPPEKPVNIQDAILAAIATTAEAQKRMGYGAEAYARENFSEAVCCKRIMQILFQTQATHVKQEAT